MMKFQHIKVFSLIIAILTFASMSDAQTTPSVKLTLKIRPHLCLRYAETQSCKLEILINWSSSKTGDFCLHSSQDSNPIKCWPQSTGADHIELRVIDNDLDYWISYKNDDLALITKTVQIATIVNNEKRKPRSRRHIWSLI